MSLNEEVDLLLLNSCRLIIFQRYDAKVVHFKTSHEYCRFEIFHFAVCNQRHDVLPLCTNFKLYAAAPARARTSALTLLTRPPSGHAHQNLHGGDEQRKRKPRKDSLFAHLPGNHGLDDERV